MTAVKIKPKNDYFCPIMLEVMDDPVLCVGDGNTYGRDAILMWFNRHNTSPLTGLILKSKELLPNRELKRLIDDWKEENRNVHSEREEEESNVRNHL